jgi:hypothetical protein
MLPLPPAILFQVTRADVGRMRRADALNLGLGVLLMAVGWYGGRRRHPRARGLCLTIAVFHGTGRFLQLDSPSLKPIPAGCTKSQLQSKSLP